MRTESVRTIAPFLGGKRCGVDVPLYAANCGNPSCRAASPRLKMTTTHLLVQRNWGVPDTGPRQFSEANK